VLAALLAERGFDSTQEIIEGKRGFARIYSDVAAPEQLTAGLGKGFENGWMIETNGHKPYACGVVLHPLIDAVIALRNREAIDPAAVSEINLKVHPLVLSITGVVEPSTGLQSKFSTVHSAAVALIDGAAGVAQYSNAKAADPAVAALRRKVKAVADDSLRKDEAYAAVVVGGSSLFGGKGSVAGTFLGTLIIGVLANILNLTGVDPFVQQLFKGALIVAAVFIMSRTKR